jgi:hypothetical protein
MKISSLKQIHHLALSLAIGSVGFLGHSVLGQVGAANAATLASASASAVLFDFSHQPLAGDAETFKDAFATGLPGLVRADAIADAELFTKPAVTGRNIASSIASGNGNAPYQAAAESSASITGFDFTVRANETFQFDWQANLFVEAVSDQPSQEHSFAGGLFGLGIYIRDTNNNLQLVDTLSLLGNDDALGLTKFDLQQTQGFTANQMASTSERLLQGRYAKTVAQATQFTVLELKQTKVAVAVPEPSMLIALGIIGTLGLRLRQRQS